MPKLYYDTPTLSLTYTKKDQRLLVFSIYYLIISKVLKMRVSFSTAISTCSLVCVAIKAKRSKVSCGAQAGGITGLIKTPSSKAIFVDKKVFSASRTYNGIIGLSVSPISNPS